MTRVRPPAVAGTFYPDDPKELNLMIRRYMRSAHARISHPKALVVPHAGYVYSGVVAAAAYACVATRQPPITRVVLLGPSHRVPLCGLALSSADTFATPLGKIPLDHGAMAEIRDLTQVRVMDQAHAQEHSIEVQLPFLQVCMGDFQLLPLLVGDVQPTEVGEVLDRLWGNDQTLIVVSSDLSHYHDYATAKSLDARTSAAIENLRIDALGPEQACGCMPLCGLLHVVKQRGMQITTLSAMNSGDTAGTRERVVGYGAYAVH